MRVRASMVIDFELTQQQAHERYGTVDPYAVVQEMQREADAKLTPALVDDLEVASASVQVSLVGYG